MADRGRKPTATFGGRSATKAKNPADSWREPAGCHGQGVFDRTVLFGERMSEARVTPSAGWPCWWL